MSLVCRTCLKLTTNTSNIFSDDLPAKIETISSLKILPDERFPSQICSDCLDKVKLLYQFRSDIITNDGILKSRVDEKMNSESDDIEDDTADYVFCLADLDDVEIELEEEKKVEDVEYEKENNCQVSKKTKVYHCKYCDFESLKYSDLMTHKNSVVHKQVKQRKCTICMKFIGIASYRTHMRAVHTDLPVSCEVCGKELKNRETLRNHMTMKHKENKSGGKVYKCKDCDFSSYVYKTYKYHTKVHRKVEKSVCTICGVLVRKDNFNKHVAYHEIAPPVSCEICGKVLKNKIILKGHMLVHQNNPFQCALCGKVYKYRQWYAAHMKKHTVGDSKTFKCPVCNKLFCNKQVLSKHIRIHTGERPYPCLFCNRGFSNNYALKSHMRQHAKEKPYSCDQCDMAFIHKVSLKTHVQSKHPVQEQEDC